MQSSISTVEVFISNTTKLFFSRSSSLLKRPKSYNTAGKNLIISTLCLMPCALVSLPAHALVTENAVTPAPVVIPATNAATIATPPATNVTTPTPNVTAPQPVTATNEISSLIASKQHPYLTQANFTNRAEDLDALYKANDYKLVWLGDDSKAVKNVTDALKLLEDAPSHGLKMADYDVQLLREKLTSLKPPLDVKSKELALYDTAISLSVLRFMHNLHYGRIDPNSLNFSIQRRTEKTLDLPALIKTSLADDSVAQLPSLVEPTLPQYQKLKQALTNYRSSEKAPPLSLDIKTSIRRGEPLPHSAEIQQYLAAYSYLPADKIDNTATTYTDTIVEGVKKFQQQHGIKASGTLNKATIAAFNKPVSQVQQITQIELAMERLRWLPEIKEGAVIIVNIPAFQLWAFDDIKQENAVTTMRVVVGKSEKHQTPQLAANMQFVDFQPYWNVPYKIAKDEILPKLAADPDYLVRQNMEFVGKSGPSALRIRQRPGKGNALGKVKFIFPNTSSVYLHDTPSVALFGRSRRDLSHGCVRVAHPQELAEFVLKDQGGWDTNAIKKAMGGKNRQVVLKKTIPVLFLYSTAFFDGNHLTFYADIYHRDAALLELLKKHEDLSDKGLFAPKEVPPTEETPEIAPIEASRTEPVTTATAKPTSPTIAPIVAIDTKPVQPVITAEKTPFTDITLSP